jgi:hypothetical protein
MPVDFFTEQQARHRGRGEERRSRPNFTPVTSTVICWFAATWVAEEVLKGELRSPNDSDEELLISLA